MKAPSIAFLLLASTLAACSVPAGENPSQRCDAEGRCPSGSVCYAGFCIADDEAEGVRSEGDGGQAHDAGIASPPDDRSQNDGAPVSADAGEPAPRDSGAPMPPDHDEGKQNEQGEDPSCARCCTPGVNVCVDVCVDLFSSFQHCGACGRLCNAGEVCLQGECCAEDEILCDGRCVDPSRDKKHCGGCGQSCERGPCKEGMCRRDP